MTTPLQLRELISRQDGPILLPGAPNALTARVIEQAGFEAVYVSGAGLTNTYLGMPDLGLLSVTELVAHVAAMADAVSIPLVVDADTGFGNALNVQRTVRQLERAGASALQLEDQVSPKKCGHFAGKGVISQDEMVGKVRAAVDARLDENMLIIARTDALSTEGLEAACDRAAAYSEAGADILFVEAPRTREQMEYIIRNVPGLHLANMVEGGLTPLMTRSELGELGFSVALYANAAMRGAVAGMRQVMDHLAEHGDTKDAAHLMIDWADRQALVRKPEFDELDRRYAADVPVTGGVA
ncbi:carboxyvinyl-carboxyphosphonate phosphorylmutase [Aeromicrobium sp. SMF47]|uniref:2-methylisocitrate lyase n=1 Tax=Aeromicrobium yanjiei TaxID=2662028 RepID=A0A5Q2MM48_9ACTN|nr:MULTISPECIES: oxaloacetate decarboxylase [Aeromicrobium]MRJ75788.1 carboxyvinyl-carboxyphosphonate phosphorylmutase [Aeromicrobium yanjiei]MRK00132.1 carboxyvinyl-carboxyphosphonate phosphorylmutase [Aeromicrobium sp. S22]QGG42961.1 carboxyvinyl-carboxyphosphonate phosphorylmutase [Aeromicrobium yanjiei]